MNQRTWGRRIGSYSWMAIVVWAMVLMMGLQTAGAAELQQIRFTSTAPTGGEWDIYPAIDKGFFAKEGLAPEMIYMMQPPDPIRLVVAGSAPFGSGGVHYSLQAYERGGKIRVITGRLYAPIYDVVARPEIKSLKDLKGKKIAIAALNSIITNLLQEGLEHNGLKRDDYQLLVVGGTSPRYAAMKSGGVAATMLAPPVNFKANDEGYPTLVKYSDMIKNLMYIGSFINTDYAKSSPDVVVRFVKATIQAQRWLNNPANKEEAIKSLMKHVPNTSEKEARRAYEYSIVQSKGYRGEGAIDPEGMKTAVDILAKYGSLKEPKPWQEYCDVSFYEKARKELGF